MNVLFWIIAPLFGFVFIIILTFIINTINKLFKQSDSLTLNTLESSSEKTIKIIKRVLLYYLIGWIGVFLYLVIINSEYILDFLPNIDSRFVED